MSESGKRETTRVPFLGESSDSGPSGHELERFDGVHIGTALSAQHPYEIIDQHRLPFGPLWR